jgi:hypothetical protein
LKRKPPVFKNPRPKTKSNKVAANLELLVSLIEHGHPASQQILRRYQQQQTLQVGPRKQQVQPQSPQAEHVRCPQVSAGDTDSQSGPSANMSAEYVLGIDASNRLFQPSVTPSDGLLLPDDPLPIHFEHPEASPASLCLLRPDDGPVQAQIFSHPGALIRVSYTTAMHLVDLFFERIQPWMPLLHMPRFKDFCARRLVQGGDSLQALSTEEKLLFYGVFAMSARFSSLCEFSDVTDSERGNKFAAEAMSMYSVARDLVQPSLIFVQGAVLLAFYHYTSGLCSFGWVLVGVCVRLAYELGLSDMDDDGDNDACPSTFDAATVDSIELEARRRVWWLIWELDTFGSILLRRPFAMDRRRWCVKLPISDGAWFAGTQVSTGALRACPEECWSSLLGHENQDERAWFLIANYLMSVVVDRSLVKEEVSLEERVTLENAISCLKFSLPPQFALESSNCLGSDQQDSSSFRKSNWIIGTHFMLSSAMSTASSMLPNADRVTANLETAPGPIAADSAPPCVSSDLVQLSTIILRWSPEHISTAHPFFAYTVAPLIERAANELPLSASLNPSPAFRSYLDLACLVQARFAEKWRLGDIAMREYPTSHTELPSSPPDSRDLTFQ